MSKIEFLSESDAKRDVTWNEVTNKPQEFTPEYHEHSVSEIQNLEEITAGFEKELKITKAELDSFMTQLEKKVDKIQGKGLSEVDFTLKREAQLLELLQRVQKLEKNQNNSGGGNQNPTGEYVISVNGKSGEITIDKESLGLENVLNKEQATKEDLDEILESISSLKGQNERIETVLKEHKNNEQIHLSKEDRETLATLGDTPKFKKGTNELDSIALANWETPLNIPALRNVVVVEKIEDANNLPDGTLVFVKE